MLSPRSQDPMLRSSRFILPRLVVLVVSMALGACDGSDSPLAPADTPPAPPEPALAPADQSDLALATTGQRIVFSSSRKGGYNLFKMDPQGNNVVRLTSFTDYADEPAWSYDNKRIAMVRPRLDASKIQHQDIYLMNADGTNKRWARSLPSSFHIRYPSWSPDGSRLVVTVILGGNSYVATLKLTTGELAFVMADGHVVQGSEPSYDATGQKILHVGSSGRTVDQVFNGVSYGLIVEPAFVGSPVFSPDGKKIAYAKAVAGNLDIFVRTLAIGETKRLTTHAGSDTQPTWSPDGSKIAFESTRSGKRQIWIMNAATGGSLTRITHTATDETDPEWSH
jgi:TolB protein